ncbi:hypothetical protein [Litoreibacter albidus]|uniref:Uncharacterized protein n=1 Tax=Litoreibacter albidus TaxID=670155 RepID=A0A1H3DRQ0_9RHOB|nr:hypothetical protein [Litoreibacter albidus]SDX69017.1 hypothetical protein SAMN04488001_0208 [Litoreibacter albidus]
MKKLIISLGVVASLLTGPAVANTNGQVETSDLETLSDVQLDALISILSGLPRQ